MDNCFLFGKKDFINNFMFDDSLINFRKSKEEDSSRITLTIREILQNSLDARLFDDKPARVDIELKTVNRSVLPGIDQIFESIDHLEPSNDYNRKIVNDMKKLRNLEDVQVLIAEDSNTRGLIGANSLDPDSVFYSYAYSKGKHKKLDNNINRGGSHGVGKISNNAASKLNLMYFSNFDEDGNKQIGGSVFLFEHEIEGERFDGVGYLTSSKVIDGKIVRIPYQLTKEYDEIFQKNTRGLKVIIPYLLDESSDLKDIVKAVCDNYFLAILNKKLEVSIKVNGCEVLVDSESINNVINDDEIFSFDNQNDSSFTRRYYNTFISGKPKDISIRVYKKDKETLDFKLYIKENHDNFKKGRIAFFKSIGMKIQDKKIGGMVREAFNGILVCDPKTDGYIKTLENQSHTELGYDNILDETERNRAKKFLNSLDKKLIEIIEELVADKFEESGELNTDDLFYLSAQAFESPLKRNRKRVQVSGGGAVIKKEIEKRDTKVNNSKGTVLPTNTRDRKPRRTQKAEDGRNSYVLSNFNVKRLSIRNKEIIEFDLSSVSKYKYGTMDLKLIPVDGEGKEYEYGFDLQRYYSSVSDMNTNKELSFSDEKICGIKLSKYKAKIILNYLDSNVSQFKFIYKVEVL